MTDLISRQAALDIIDAELSGWLTDDERLHLEGVGTGIECLPTIDPVKHGKWVPTHERSLFSHPDSITYVCSECGNKIYTVFGMPRTTTYCWECGAKMDKENEDE